MSNFGEPGPELPEPPEPEGTRSAPIAAIFEIVKHEEQLYAVVREYYDLCAQLYDTFYYFQKAKKMAWFDFCDQQDRMHGVGKNGNGESEEEESSDEPTEVPFICSFQWRTRSLLPEAAP